MICSSPGCASFALEASANSPLCYTISGNFATHYSKLLPVGQLQLGKVAATLIP